MVPVASRPTRARGLKRDGVVDDCVVDIVAPHAGAWIETCSRMVVTIRCMASRPTRARGLKLASRFDLGNGFVVAPHAGAWIETASPRCRAGSPAVAPHAGAWIETPGRSLTRRRSGVAPHAGAWIETSNAVGLGLWLMMSRPTRARGLKHRQDLHDHGHQGWSRPTRARGLKQGHLPLRHHPCGVAPPAGAWIETAPDRPSSFRR